MSRDAAPEVEVGSRGDLRAWLAANHDRAAGVWLVTWRKAAGDRHLPWVDIVRECLCWGWVDSLPRGKDDLRTMLWIAPRKPGSGWSRVNKDHIAALRAEGSMTPAGEAVIARAVADGSWAALDAVEDGVVPDDPATALDGQDGARAAWDGWPRSVRRGALEQVAAAKTPATRAKRIAAILTAAADGTRPFQWTGRKG